MCVCVNHIRALTNNSHKKTNKFTSNKIYIFHAICHKTDILKLTEAFNFVQFFSYSNYIYI